MSEERSEALIVCTDAVNRQIGTRYLPLESGHDKIALAVRIKCDALDNGRQALAGIGPKSRSWMVEGFECGPRVGDPPDRRIGARRCAHPCKDQIVESPVNGNLALLVLKNRKAEFLHGKTVADSRNHAKLAGAGLRDSRLLHGCFGLG